MSVGGQIFVWKNPKKIIIANMMMMTKNPEYIATEDLAIAKSTVAISSAHRDDDGNLDSCKC